MARTDNTSAMITTAVVSAFLDNVNWEIVEQRHKDSKAGRFTARSGADAGTGPGGRESALLHHFRHFVAAV